MRTRRVRATFLLQVVVILASLGLFGLTIVAATSRPIQLGTVVFLIAFWFFAIEVERLPLLLEHVATRHAARQAGRINSIWFVDIDAEEGRTREQEREGVRENPGLW